MTDSWDRIVATGRGQLAWRVSIDGLPSDLVSHTGMVTSAASDGRARVHGLSSQGFTFGQQVDLVTCEAKGPSFAVRFVNTKAGAALFGKRAQFVTYLEADVTNAATTIPCEGAQTFPTSGWAHVNQEAFAYTATSTAGFLGCTRGEWNTLACYHYTTDGDRLRYPEITEHPVIIEGRRVRFYAYAPGDDKQGDGTLVWIGVASTGVAFNGQAWSFQVDSLFRVMDSDMGGDIADPVPLRGIYYPSSAPLVIRFNEKTSNSSSSTVARESAIAIAGFWESQGEFLADLNTALAAELSAASFAQTDLVAVEIGDSWAIEFTTASATPRYMTVRAMSPLDAFEEGPRVPGADRLAATGLSADTTYRYSQRRDLPGVGTVPRACFGDFDLSRIEAESLDASQKTDVDGGEWPSYRVYPGGGSAITSNIGAVQADWSSPGTPPWGTAFSGVFEGNVSTVNSSDRYIDLFRPDLGALGSDDDRGGLVSDYAVCISRDAVKLRLGRDYGVGHVGDLITTLQNQAEQYVNTGAVPMIRPQVGGLLGDFVISGSELDLAAADSRFAGRRLFSVFTEVELADLIKHECRMLGVYPVIQSGRFIAFRRLRLPSASEVSGNTITASLVITDDQIVSWERAALGIYNTVLIRTGYDPIEDEHRGDVYKIRDVAAFGQSPASRVLEIAPKSGEPDVNFEELLAIGQRTLGVFGGPYIYVTIEVPLRFWNTKPGDVVSVTWSKLPNGVGTMGVSGKLGIVTAIEMEPMEAKGRMTLLMSDQRIGGYAPESLITIVTDGTSGTNGPFTASLSPSDFPSGQTAADHFEVGDALRVMEWNVTTDSNNVRGTVTAVAGNSLSFTTDALWNWSGADWVVGASISSEIDRDNQKVYAYVADVDGIVHWNDENTPSFTLAP